MGSIIFLVVLVAIALWVVGAYNALIALKNQVANAWKQIDVQLKRRHDLIPNLVNTVKGAMEFERGTLEAVIAARNKAVSATGVKETAQAEGQLTQALGRLFALTEAYPDLKANQNVLQLQEELTSTENKVGFARQLYNDTATQYNTKQATFPTLLVAGLARAFAPAEHLHDVGADLGAVAVLPFLVLPFARAETALDVDLRALLQVLAGDLRQAPEERHAVPLRGFLHLSRGLVLPAVGGGHADVGDRLAARQIARLRVRAEVAHQDDLVH